VKFTLLIRGSADYFVDRYSERKEDLAEFKKRIAQRTVTN
jgi:arsenic resistance protein ArsH